MNAYYHKNMNYNSNSRIYKDCFVPTRRKANPLQKLLGVLFSILFVAVQTETRARTLRVAKAVMIPVIFVSLFVVVGAVESGAIGLGMGFVTVCALLAAEYVCLRPKKTK